MKKYEMIVLDLDGTLLTSKQTIGKKTKQELIALQEQGMILVLASGRNYYKMKEYGKQLNMFEHEGYFIEGNGIRLRHLKSQEVFELAKMSAKQAQKICQYLMKFNEELIIIFDDGMYCYLPENIYMKKQQMIKQYHLDPEVLSCGPYDDFVDHRKAYPNFKYINDIHEIVCDINKVCMKVDEGKLKQIFPEIKEELDEYWCGCVSSMWFEITLPNINKANMLKHLCERLQISLETVIAFGDGENDIDLLKQVGLSVAMGNALEQVKKQCNIVTLDHDHEGIYEALKLHNKNSL